MSALKKTPLVIFMLGSLTAFAPMSVDMYLPALPAIADDLNTDAAQMQLTLASFFVAFAVGQLIYGPLADRFGRKPPLYAGLSLFVLASLACLWVTDVNSLIVLRFFQALGACAGLVIARAVVRDSFDTREAAGLYAGIMLVMGVAPMLAPLLGSQLLVLAGWHSIFAALAIYGALVMLLSWWRLPETLAPALQQPISLGFVWRSYLGLWRSSYFRGFALVNGIAMAGLFAFIASSSFVFMTQFGMDAQSFGLLFGANAFFLILATQINNRLLTRWRPLQLLKGSMPVLWISGLVFGLLAWTEVGGFWAVIWPLFIYTGSLGFVLPNASALAFEPYRHEAGKASALYGTVSNFSGAVAALLVSVLPLAELQALGLVLALCGVVTWRISRGLQVYGD